MSHETATIQIPTETYSALYRIAVEKERVYPGAATEPDAIAAEALDAFVRSNAKLIAEPKGATEINETIEAQLAATPRRSADA